MKEEALTGALLRPRLEPRGEKGREGGGELGERGSKG